MSEHHTYKKIEMVGSSTESIEDAIDNALSECNKSIDNMDWFEVAPYSFYRDTHADYQFFPEADVELEPHFCEAVKDNEQFRAVYRGERIPELFKDYKRIWLFHGHDGAPLYSGVDEPVALEAEKHQSSGLALHLLVPREP